MTLDAPSYFSDVEFGPPPAILDELPPAAWVGICVTFHRFLDQHYFGAEFPEQCYDGQGICGTSVSGVRDLLTAHIPAFTGLPDRGSQPGTVPAMDLVVFCWKHAQQPAVRSHHDYFHHDHFDFDQQAGRERWRTEINTILERNGTALRQEADGTVVRVATAAVETLTRSPIPSTGDGQLDGKLATALAKYRDVDVDVRREALEALWDAFERIKTVLDPTDKKRSVTALVERMAPDTPAREVLDAEFQQLTSIGNNFQIRHHEVGKTPVEPALIDLLFARCLALVEGGARAIISNRP